MILTIQLFAGIAERLGTSLLEYEYTESPLTAALLKESLALAYPEAASQIRTSFLAVNQQYAPADTMIKPEDELALIPPFQEVTVLKGPRMIIGLHSPNIVLRTVCL